MPTPVQAFAEVAARHGGVDPCDVQAVRRFYGETLLTLEPAQILAILEDLLASEGRAKGERPETLYPTGADLPSLDASPPVSLPLLALRWREILGRLIRRRA